jgi:2-polyprenyl-3-methyl-5-hydroxy-6-metoxy-1,4-benzoquinol methylase
LAVQEFVAFFLKFDKNYFTKYSSTRTKQVLKLYFTRLIEQTNSRDVYGKKLLDIGCGYGYFLKLASAFGFETYGIDISQHAIKQARKVVNAKFFCSDIQDILPFAANFFDIITMFDVIEHLEKPYSALQQIHRVLKPRGIFIITTPNMNSLSRRTMGKKWIGFSDETHRIFYTIYSLEFILKTAGFKVLKRETIFTPLPHAVSKLLRPLNLGGKIWVICLRKD